MEATPTGDYPMEVREDGIIYKHVRELGQGRFAVVHLYADPENPNRTMALKIEKPLQRG